MAAHDDQLAKLASLVQPGSRNRLVARGLARGMLWRKGVLPLGSPEFSDTLSADLLDNGYGALALCLALRDQETDTVTAGFRVAAESIESAVRRGDPEEAMNDFHLMIAAAAFHLGHFAARSYCLLPSPEALRLSASEQGLAQLMRRKLVDLRESCVQWHSLNSDELVAKRLIEDDAFSEEDAVTVALSDHFFRAMGFFDSALVHGDRGLYANAQRLFDEASEACGEGGYVGLWWTSILSRHLTEDLWETSLHTKLPRDDAQTEWNRLRDNFIRLLATREIAELELWPSQLGAAARTFDVADDLIVALPTSAGKTKIAELCILRCLSQGKRVIYVTPLRALSAQVENTLSRTFVPLGFTVSALYGASGVAVADVDALRSSTIVVATPEKLDFALRQDPQVIDDVGLVVLDEGHMIGLGSREIRYEVLVQSLLKRPDALTRRIVCLSAVLATGDSLSDFTAWIRSDSPGLPLESTWRPTRQRSGIITWENNGGLLQLIVDGEKPYVPGFILPQSPRSRRRNPFPSNQNEFVAATADRFVKDGQRVLIYAPLRSSVETMAGLLLKLNRQGYVPNYLTTPAEVERAVAIGEEWLGGEHEAVKALRIGVAVHHGGLPRQFLLEVEGLLDRRILPIAVSSPTMAQGLNLSCSTLVLSSIYRKEHPIPVTEYANVVGRAGRAFVDLDGLTVYPIFETEKRRKRVRDFDRLRKAAETRPLESGLLLLIRSVATEIARRVGGSEQSIIDYALNHEGPWLNDPVAPDVGVVDKQDPETMLADLDTAILATVDSLDCPVDQLADLLDMALRSSLWRRRLERLSVDQQGIQKSILRGRAKWLWNNSNGPQRHGFFAAGIGHGAGSFIGQNVGTLVSALVRAERAIERNDAEQAVEPIIVIADKLLDVHPFRVKKRPAEWRRVIKGWLLGVPMSTIIAESDDSSVEFVQDGLVFRLVWGTEAIRVYAKSNGVSEVDSLKGHVPMALTYGVPMLSAAYLIKAGLPSRVMATDVARRFPSTVVDAPTSAAWLSAVVGQVQPSAVWHGAAFQQLWNSFSDRMTDPSRKPWVEDAQEYPVLWYADSLPDGARVRIVQHQGIGVVSSLDLTPVGRLGAPVPAVNGHILATVRGDRIVVRRFGPPRPV